MRRSLKIAGIGCGVLIVLAAGFLGWLTWELRPQPPISELPALVRGLPSPIRSARNAFRTRIEKRFPNGMPADALATALTLEGFTPIPTIQNPISGLKPPWDYAASIKQQGGMCLRTWTVTWNRDEEGHARDIDGKFYYDCP